MAEEEACRLQKVICPPRLTLLFPAGSRPDTADIERLTIATDGPFLAATSQCAGSADGRLAILTGGLTFDLLGLRPARPTLVQTPGFGGQDAHQEFETVELAPSSHIVAGSMLAPVLRAWLGLAANLSFRLPVIAVGWSAAETFTDPSQFALNVLNWLSGGAFPVKCLTQLVENDDGSVASKGLAHFIGREMHLEGRPNETKAETLQLAIRLIDRFVRLGAPSETCEVKDGRNTLLVEPSQTGKRIWVWRGEG